MVLFREEGVVIENGEAHAASRQHGAAEHAPDLDLPEAGDQLEHIIGKSGRQRHGCVVAHNRLEGQRLALLGILRGKRYTYKWLSLFVQFYILEGLTRATSDHGLSQQLAIGESILAIILFITVILYVRATRPPPEEKAAAAS